MRRPALATVAIVAALIVGACGASSTAPATSAQPLTLTSSAFAANQAIPQRYACDGENLSPPLAWTGTPATAASLVLIMDDPDAVRVVGSVYDHWLLFNIPATVTSLPEGLPNRPELPDTSRHGQNSARVLGYSGPCPPSGQNHGYVFTLYAIDSTLDLKAGARKDAILQAIEGRVLAKAQIIGMYASP
jgi:Raf kinase inhibitor-like YbhB/YbcL family protein